MSPTERGLTLARRRTLSAVGSWHLLQGYAPSLRELFPLLGYNSTNSMSTHLAYLRREGFIDWIPQASRTLRLTTAGWELVLGNDEARLKTRADEQVIAILKRQIDEQHVELDNGS